MTMTMIMMMLLMMMMITSVSYENWIWQRVASILFSQHIIPFPSTNNPLSMMIVMMMMTKMMMMMIIIFIIINLGICLNILRGACPWALISSFECAIGGLELVAN